jgi:hypothetical protein
MQLKHGVFAAAVLLAGCATTATELVNSWKDPAASGVRFKKVLTVCACKDDGMRRTVEDRLAGAIQGSQPSYSVLSDDQLGDPVRTRAALRDGGFDGVVMLKLVSVDKSQTYVPGSAYVVPAGYHTMYGGWGYGGYAGYGAVYDPGYVREDQLVNFDTNIYRVADEKLLWASRSQTSNPDNINKMIDDIIAETVSEMKKQKVIS